MAVAWEIDPTSEDAANVPLSLTTAPLRLLAEDAMDLTPPDIDAIYASSADTEGDPYVGSRHRNRTITLNLLAKDSTDALTQTAIYGVQQKVDKLRREGGTLKYTTMAGTAIVFDVIKATFKPQFTQEHYALNKAVPFGLEFECKPYGRGAPVQQSDHTEATLPCLVFTDSGLAGDVPGLGKLVIDEDQGVDQWWVVWGLQSRYYDSASSAALFYEAEGRTALGGSGTAAGPSGASGAGSNVMRSAGLGTSYQAILSSQATGGGAHWSHVGIYRVFARVQTPTTNTGAISVALQWGEGDFRRATQNAATIFPIDYWDGTWRLLDLGIVSLAKVAQGTQRWEARILAKSTVGGDTIDVDYLMLVPADEGSGAVAAAAWYVTPSSFSARDEFNQTAGALAGKTAGAGGNWAGAGSASDFTVDATAHTATRAINDGGVFSGRFANVGGTTYTDVLAQADMTIDTSGSQCALGMFARYVDANNFARAIVLSQAPSTVRFYKRIAGSDIEIQPPQTLTTTDFLVGAWWTIRLQIDSRGRYRLWLFQQGQAPVLIMSGYDAVFATGGTLASGTAGLYDAGLTTSRIRSYDNFYVAVPPADAAVFASQSLEVRHDRTIREDSSGTIWADPSSYEGDRLRVPPAGKEGRTTRVIVKACRNDPISMPDPGIDDISARLTYTPRYLVLPS